MPPQGRLHAAVPIVTFGCLALLGALLLLTLPETRGRPLPQTVEDILESSERWLFLSINFYNYLASYSYQLIHYTID